MSGLPLALMARLIARLAPKGLYALAVDRQGCTPKIHCVFEQDSDALKVAKGRTGKRSGPIPRLGQPADDVRAWTPSRARRSRRH